MTAEKILSIARKEIGVVEVPQNEVKYNTWYYKRKVNGGEYAWCMVFQQWIFDQAGFPLPCRTASCGTLMDYAKKAGRWVTSDYKPGDVFIMKSDYGRHTGIVELVRDDGYLQTIEGNTSTASDGNGGMVKRRLRPIDILYGAYRPEYEEEKEEIPEIEEDDDMMTLDAFEALMKEYRAKLQDNDCSNYSADARQWAIENGIIAGTGKNANGENNYAWEDQVSREQLVTLLYRFAKYMGKI